MSYDLYFYQPKRAALTKDQIAAYLGTHLVQPNEQGDEWFFANPDTEVYYLFDYSGPDAIDANESFSEYDNTHFSFNLNFMRPSFFGREAFRFTERFMNDLDLYVLNPQSATETPYKATATALFEEWNRINLAASTDHFSDTQSCYLPADQSDQAWEYNFHRQTLQEEAGIDYFVPRVFFFKTRQHHEAFTLAVWPAPLPAVIPPADHYLITRQYKRWFRTVEDRILVSRQELDELLGRHAAPFHFRDCRIIHPAPAQRLKNKVKALRGGPSLEEFAERLAIENLYNAKPA